MRLRERFNIINSIDFNLLRLTTSYEMVNGKNISVVKITERQKEEIKKILEIPELEKRYKKEFAEGILEVSYILFESDKVSLLVVKLNKIIDMLMLFKEIFIDVYPSLDDKSVSIKLPDSYDVIEIGEIYKKIGKSLNQVITKEPINGNLKLSNFDNGSLWIDIMLGTTAAVHVFASIVWSASYCMKEYKKLKLIEIEYEKNEISLENLKNIKDMNKELMKKYVEKESENILTEHYEITGQEDPDFLERMKNTIIEFSKLIEKGTEVHPALEVANEIKHEFPDLSKLEFLDSKIRKIEKKL